MERGRAFLSELFKKYHNYMFILFLIFYELEKLPNIEPLRQGKVASAKHLLLDKA